MTVPADVEAAREAAYEETCSREGGAMGPAPSAGTSSCTRVEVVDTLTPITQKHTIEGLVMGDA